MAKQTIDLIVTGGEATGGPPLGPALGPLGVNVLQVVNKINEKTGDFEGMKVPVTVEIDTETKRFDIDVGIPTTSALIAKEAEVSKGAELPGSETIADVSMGDIVRVAEAKNDSVGLPKLKSMVLQVLGTCVSMGITVEAKDPVEVMREVREGEYDEVIEGARDGV